MSKIGVALLLASLAAATPAAASPRAFLTKAIKGDNSEIRLGRLAASRAVSPAVRRFGLMLERDHSRAKAEAVPVARRHHVAIPWRMADEAMRERQKLLRLHGRTFDREFARYMVNDHRHDIADFTREVRSGDPADARALARRTLPTLRKHLRVAERL